MITRNPIHLILVAATTLFFAAALSACESATLKANEQEVQQQQAQIEQNQLEIQKLMTQQQGSGGGGRSGSSSVAAAGNGCDKSVMAAATRHGGQKLAAGDFTHALGYYQDALSACPNNPRAEVNVARAYEAAGNPSSAIEHYRIAAHSTDPAESTSEEVARNALVRLGSN
ncbi:MAG: tetratricopeptide repeat protein [Candidatus Binataceae bacterium]